MSKKTYHAKNGKFTSFDRANIVNQGGERFKLVRTLEPIKDQGDGDQQTDPATAENVAQVKAKVSSMAGRIAPQWISLNAVTEARPGPHQNPWPQKKTTASELAKSLEDLAKISLKYPDTATMSKRSADLLANIAWAMKKGDKAKVKRLRDMLIKQGEVSQGIVNEIQNWLMGWV